MDIPALLMSGRQPDVRQLLELSRARLTQSDSPELDVQLLLASVLDKPRSWLYAWPEYVPTDSQLAAFQRLLAARERGEPIAYLLGQRDFWTFKLHVNPSVLIPRPDTELLVETALELVKSEEAVIADLGTGSGAIALALASERPRWQVYATELSPDALAVAECNRADLGFANVTLLPGSWCEPLPEQIFDLIISNPPYIGEDDPHLQSGDVRFEPRSALVAPEMGLADLHAIARQAVKRLGKQGWLLLEHGWEQGESVRNLLQQAGYAAIETRLDQGGRERMTLGRKA